MIPCSPYRKPDEEHILGHFIGLAREAVVKYYRPHITETVWSLAVQDQDVDSF